MRAVTLKVAAVCASTARLAGGAATATVASGKSSVSPKSRKAAWTADPSAPETVANPTSVSAGKAGRAKLDPDGDQLRPSRDMNAITAWPLRFKRNQTG